MTEREAQIFQWIKENPLITQQEIAERAGITRSSVAVHISNLMKKGMIYGKGYVLQEENYVTIAGAVNVDISGTPHQELVAEDSNPGRTSFSFGGVGRNIAENLCRLGENVELITVLGDDFYATELEKNCRTTGIGLLHALKVPGQSTSTYLCINNFNGDMAVAINSMDIYDFLTPEYLDGKLPMINKGGLLIVDTNIPEKSLQFLAEKCTVPIFAEPVSTKKAAKLKGILNRLSLIKPNLLELELLSGIKVTDEASLCCAIDMLLDQGVRHVVVSLGKNGAYYGSRKQKKHYENPPCRIVNTTGCGDSMLGAIAWAYQRREPMEEAVQLGLAAASICIEHEGAICNDLTAERLLKRRNDRRKRNES